MVQKLYSNAVLIIALLGVAKASSDDYYEMSEEQSYTPSTTILTTTEAVPSEVESIEVYPLGSTAFLLTWKEPLNPNGNLTGYRIYYEEMKRGFFGERMERVAQIYDPSITRAKLANLKSNTYYKIYVVAVTKAGEGKENYVFKNTLPRDTFQPSVPNFTWKQMPSFDGLANLRTEWQPSVEDGRPGSYFYTKYRPVGSAEWEQTKNELYEVYQIVRELNPHINYEFQVVSVDGEFKKESGIQQVHLSN